MIQITKSCKLETPCYDDGKCHFAKPCDCQYLTNADRIRAMSDEELAAFLEGLVIVALGDYSLRDNQRRLDWLKQEVKE